MSEITFSGNSKYSMDVLASTYAGEFMEVGANLFESEELVDLVYRAYLPLAGDGFVGRRGASQYVCEAYIGGFYIPCTRRIILSGQIDLLNDDLPEYAGYVSVGEDCTFFCAQKIKAPPRNVSSLPFSRAVYACTMFAENPATSTRQLRKQNMTSALEYATVYVAVMPSGALVPCMSPARLRSAKQSYHHAALIPGFAAAINANNDKINIWNVKTSEYMVNSVQTPLVLGVDEEHVKSLFYMRTLPVTESGRKRPILHWTRAHKRRLREGIDVDVRKHLRGIERFEMEGFEFEITNPIKRTLK